MTYKSREDREIWAERSVVGESTKRLVVVSSTEGLPIEIDLRYHEAIIVTGRKK